MRALLRSRTSRGTVPSNWPASEQKGTSVTSFCIWRLGTVALIARFVQIRFKPELVAPGQVLSWYFFGTSKWIVSFLAVIQRSIHRTYQHGSLAVSLFSCRLEGPLLSSFGAPFFPQEILTAHSDGDAATFGDPSEHLVQESAFSNEPLSAFDLAEIPWLRAVRNAKLQIQNFIPNSRYETARWSHAPWELDEHPCSPLLASVSATVHGSWGSSLLWPHFKQPGWNCRNQILFEASSIGEYP